MTQLPDHLNDVGRGWSGILEILHRRVSVINPDYSVIDVKEKFGTLRVHLNDETPEIWQMIADAELASGRVCEECGSSGDTTSINGWWRTLCRKHRFEELTQ